MTVTGFAGTSAGTLVAVLQRVIEHVNFYSRAQGSRCAIYARIYAYLTRPFSVSHPNQYILKEKSGLGCEIIGVVSFSVNNLAVMELFLRSRGIGG